MRFSFRGFVTSVDPRRMLASDVTFTRLRREMVERLRLTAADADRILDDMMVRALTRFGDHIVGRRGDLLTRIVELRERLDDLYHDLLNFETATSGRVARSGRPTIARQLADIQALYREIDDALEGLRRPAHEVVPPRSAVADAATTAAAEVRRTVARAAREGRNRRLPGHAPRDPMRDISDGRFRRRGFRAVRGSRGRSFRRVFSDGSEVTFTIDNGRYRVRTRSADGVVTEFHEYDILTTPYGRRPFTSSLIQAHHGLQNSLMTDLFSDFGYNGDAAPTIWLRNSRRGSPHGAITATQNSGRTSRRASARTLSEIRRHAIEDLALTDMPAEQIANYLRHFDEYFERAVLPGVLAAGRRDLLGSWRPASGVLP